MTAEEIAAGKEPAMTNDQMDLTKHPCCGTPIDREHKETGPLQWAKLAPTSPKDTPMTIDPVELERLSKAATQGVWEISAYYTGTGPDEKCCGLVEVEDFPIGIIDEEGATAESLSPNLEFVTTLVNAYRTGQLILAQPSGDVVEAVKDAARYRWLRDHSCPPHNFYISVPDEFHGVKYGPDEVDAYIDAARAALGEKP